MLGSAPDARHRGRYKRDLLRLDCVSARRCGASRSGLKILIGLHRCCGDRNPATCWQRRSGERRLQSKQPKRSLAKPKQVLNAASLLFLPIPFCISWQRRVARPTIASLSPLPTFTKCHWLRWIARFWRRFQRLPFRWRNSSKGNACSRPLPTARFSFRSHA